MKKALVVLLILAVAGGVFAQDLVWSGKIYTGLQWQKPDEGAAFVGLNNDDDDYPTRLEFGAAYTKDNYGLKFVIRNDNFTQINGLSIPNAYVWADFLNKVLNLKFGLIDDSVWVTEGDEGFHASTGGGLRLEVKPIEGLNAGIVLTLPNGDDNQATGESFTVTKGNNPFYTHVKYFLPETAFGVQYESALFNAQAGVKLDSAGDGHQVINKDVVNVPGITLAETLNGMGATVGGGGNYMYDLDGDGTLDDTGIPAGYNSISYRFWDEDAPKSNAAARAYVGFSIKAIEALTAAVEAQFYNIGDFNTVGFAWVDEKFEYAISPVFRAGAVFTEYFYGSKVASIYSSDNGADGDYKVGIYFKAKPYFAYDINQYLTAGLEVGFALQDKILNYDVNVKPKITYKLGSNAAIDASYNFDMADYKEKFEGEQQLTNTVQVNFNWTF
jgi:hypothetical protein